MATPAIHFSANARTGPILARGCRRLVGLVSLALLLVVALASSAQAASVGLGTADSFSVLGGSTVTNTGPTTMVGDLGVSPGTAVTGFPPGLVGGAIHKNDAVAGKAKSDLVTAYNDAAGRPSTATVSGDLAGRTLVSGVYTSASSLGLSGHLTLDAQGDPSAVFVFQAGSTLTTGSSSRVQLIGGAQACNVFWKVGSSATIGTATNFKGNILALTSISLTTGATLDGRALARNGAVTLQTNTITRSACTTGGGDGSGGGGNGGGGNGGGGGGSSITGSGRPVVTGPSGHLVCRQFAQSGRQHVRLAGKVRRGTFAIRYYFQFGKSRHYGRRTETGRVARRAKSTRVHAVARRLAPGTTYHYRLVGVGPRGRKTRGRDRTFRTRSRAACRARPAGPTSPPRPPRSRPPGFTG